MPWIGNDFIYSKGLLLAIAQSYISLYQGLPVRFGGFISNPWLLAEYKADFDMALSSLGKHWSGVVGEFRDYRYFGKTQQAIIADIMGIDDRTLEGLGFYDIPRLRGVAYFLMTKFLNGDSSRQLENLGDKNVKETKC